jgi:hypothetical protein
MNIDFAHPHGIVLIGGTVAGLTPDANSDNVQKFPLERDAFRLNRYASIRFCLRMIFSDLASPAEAATGTTNGSQGFAQAGSRFPLFGIMR